jgi:dTDP-glucose 4,6-dehydratase
MTTESELPIHSNYSPNRILVTGGCGFIGSFLVRHLLREYDNIQTIVTYDKITNCSKPHPFVGSHEHYNFYDRHVLVKGDICDEEKVLETLKHHKIDTIVHMAAETHVDYSFRYSFEFTKTNVMGTHVLLQCALELKDQIKRFIHVSTDEVYGESVDNEPFTEKSILNPTNPYAATKVAAEALVLSYVSSFNLPCVITRGNNVFGPEQFPDKVVPKFICRLMHGLPVEIHGDGSSKRSFLYVTDTARALDTIMRHGTIGQIYNISAKEETSILDLAQWLVNYFYPKNKDDPEYYHNHITFVDDRHFNDKRYHINSQALHDLGWQPTVELEDGLIETVQWYENNALKMWWWEGKMDGALAAHPHF